MVHGASTPRASFIIYLPMVPSQTLTSDPKKLLLIHFSLRLDLFISLTDWANVAQLI